MQLITKEIMKKLKNNPRDTETNKPYLKLFNPTGAQTWLISEIEDDEDTMYGICDLGMGYPELGSVSLKELAGLKLPPFGLTVERDISFEPTKTLSEYATEAREHRVLLA